MFSNKNCCDGIYKSYDVHFTRHCDNKCPYCIDKQSRQFGDGKPNVVKIFNTIYDNRDNITDVLILGGEPFLYIHELYTLIHIIKSKTKLKVYATTSFPKTAVNQIGIVFRILELIDGLNISAHHYDQEKGDKIRGTKSNFDRMFYLNYLPKEKIRICLNLVKGILDTKEEIITAVDYFREFGSIKLNELQHSPQYYSSFEDIFGYKFPSPYYNGCQSYIGDLFGYEKEKVLLKRSCFLVEQTRKASFMDGMKVLFKKPNKEHVFGVVFEDGTLTSSW